MGNENDEYDTPSPSSLASIILILIASISFLLSFSVILLLTFVTPSATSSSKLILLLHLSISLGIIFKFPYLLSDGILCQVSGFIINYVGCQIILITYSLFSVTNIFSIVANNEVTNSYEYKINPLIVILVLVVPLVTGFVPIFFTEYHQVGPWCQIDHAQDSSTYVIITIYVFLWILQLVIFSQFFYLIYLLWRLPSDLIYLTISRILAGPISFAVYTCVIFLSIDVVVLYSVLYSHGPQGQYYIDYTYVILQYLLGFGYAIIYFTIERKNLQVFLSPSPSTSLLTSSVFLQGN
jgi:hypothetical protein